MVDPRCLPDSMAIALGDFSAGCAHDFAQTRQRQLGSVEMDAQRCWRIVVDTDDMRPLDAFALRQRCYETIETCVSCVGKVGQ